MMGEQKSEPQLFNYAVNLEKRVRWDHPLRQVKAAINFSFVREEVAHCYGKRGGNGVRAKCRHCGNLRGDECGHAEPPAHSITLERVIM